MQIYICSTHSLVTHFFNPSSFFQQLDCGIHPGLNGFAGLPFIDSCDPSKVDLMLITQWVQIDDDNDFLFARRF